MICGELCRAPCSLSGVGVKPCKACIGSRPSASDEARALPGQASRALMAKASERGAAVTSDCVWRIGCAPLIPRRFAPLTVTGLLSVCIG